MTTARHIVALLQSYVAEDNERFLSIATQLAAHEARQGHGKLAQELRELIDSAKGKTATVARRGAGPVPLAQPKGELSAFIAARYSDARVLTEQRQQARLRARALTPRRKLLLVGPPGSGKTMTAAAIAGELKLPLFTILYDGLIGKLLGETAGRLRLVFDAIALQRGVYFFDEFDAIGTQRSGPNDVGEIRRVLNSFLQFLENDDGPSLIIAATNHPELLDKALFRRFDDVITYELPSADVVRGIVEARLTSYLLDEISWDNVIDSATGLSQAEISRAADEAAKIAVLAEHNNVTTAAIIAALNERKKAIS